MLSAFVTTHPDGRVRMEPFRCRASRRRARPPARRRGPLFWAADAHRAGAKRIGAVITSLESCFEAVNAGQAVGLVPESAAEFARGWAGITFVPVSDLSSSILALAWPSATSNPLVAPFVETVRALVTTLGAGAPQSA